MLSILKPDVDFWGVIIYAMASVFEQLNRAEVKL